MTASDKKFAGSIPEFYDTYLVPLIFDTYATDLADRVATLDPKTVLETAAGTGVVPRALASKLGSDARYVVTDLNQPMLDHAASKEATTLSNGFRRMRLNYPLMMTRSTR